MFGRSDKPVVKTDLFTEFRSEKGGFVFAPESFKLSFGPFSFQDGRRNPVVRRVFG